MTRSGTWYLLGALMAILGLIAVMGNVGIGWPLFGVGAVLVGAGWMLDGGARR